MTASNPPSEVPSVPHRLHGADRSKLGEKGWAEVAENKIGHPDNSNISADFYEPASELEQPADREL